MRRIIKTVCATALCVVLFTGCSQPAAQSVSTETSTAEVEPLKIEFKEAEITKRTDTKSNIPEYTIISDSNEKYDVVSSYGEGFPADAAQYAVDNMTGVDWNANALEKAKQYYYDMAMSKSAVYDQLTSSYGEQFTASQAQYAIDHLD